ncbi:MAG: dihydrodipicolinate synthase family protein [Candidatus Thermoplasmatota archaeon]|nr:dihydrodipicolinate synthase family protein [Candidatus Thermoplasmatota archaeon]
MERSDFQKRFFGIVPPLVTPFDDEGEVDYGLFGKEVEKMLKLGISGVSVGGSTGEGETLSLEELVKLCSIAKEATGGRIPVIGGIIADSTIQVIKKGLALKKIGVDALMITPVHYLFSNGDAGIRAFYSEIHEKTGMPIIVYNVVPWNIPSPNILLKMASEGIIASVKQSGGDIHALGDLLAQASSKLPVFTAIDDMLFPSFMLGAVGSICAINTVLPATSIKIFDAVKKGDYETARKLHEVILPAVREILKPDMPARIKLVMNNSGWVVGVARRPLLVPEGKDRENILTIAKKVSQLERS